ncbi:Fc receptor-like protein 5 isoform X2 [Haplochromis burtoni]|uniref:Fc receptor-like protein 5 isoform X2 n=1 Tax=Haplochromis burtoni TaxID=8153 RepID=UPI001C2CD497|nr:Fc receptor-like protein 5 isoform X2 [Haplochromis burtoni]
MQLTPFCLMLTCLQVNPDRSQFFRYDNISLSCGEQLNNTGWKVKRKTLAGGTRPCSSGWGYASSGSTCIIGQTYPPDSGVYWCESVSGEQSNVVNITITDQPVILESPALPVSEGATVTLHCTPETKSFNQFFDFYKDGHCIKRNSTGEITIKRVSKSDEGLYKCSISGGEESLGSWLAVDASSQEFPSSTSAAEPAAPCSFSVLRLVFHLLVGTPYLVSTVLLGLIYRDRRRAQNAAKRMSTDHVIMEMVV